MTNVIQFPVKAKPEEEEEEQNKLIEGVPLEIHEALLTVRQVAMRHGFYTRGIRLEEYRRDSVCGGRPEYLALPERLYGIAIDVKRS